MDRQRPVRALSEAPPEARQPAPMAEQQPRGGECCSAGDDEPASHRPTRRDKNLHC